MRSVKVLLTITALTLGCSTLSFAAEDAAEPAPAAASLDPALQIVLTAFNRAP